MKYQVNNVLATVQQLQVSGSQLDGIPKDLEISIIFAGAWLTQCAGVLLRLPQNIVAQAIILFTRFWVGPEGGSIAEFGAKVSGGGPRFPLVINSSPKIHIGRLSSSSIHVRKSFSLPTICQIHPKRIFFSGLIPCNLFQSLITTEIFRYFCSASVRGQLPCPSYTSLQG